MPSWAIIIIIINEVVCIIHCVGILRHKYYTYIHGTGLETCRARALLTYKNARALPVVAIFTFSRAKNGRQRAFFVGLQRRACKPYEKDEHQCLDGGLLGAIIIIFSDKALSTAGGVGMASLNRRRLWD